MVRRQYRLCFINNVLNNETNEILESNDVIEEEDNNVIAPSEIGAPDIWHWNYKEKTDEVIIYGQNQTSVLFHPYRSKGTVGIRGTKALDSRIYYWELHVSQRIFGTSMMFGVATKLVRSQSLTYTNLLGEDNQGWGLSHKGLLWHDGQWAKYTKPFKENEEATVGLLFDGVAGTLTYFKDGKNLGIAFRNLDRSPSKLYPFVCSTTARSKMTLSTMRRDFATLQDRCRKVIVRNSKTRAALNRLPKSLYKYVQMSLPTTNKLSFKKPSLKRILDM